MIDAPPADTPTTIQRLRAELEDAFAARAHLYRLLLDELSAEIGAAPAEALIARMLERRGREVAARLFAGIAPGDAAAVVDRFLAVSPDFGRMYPHARGREGAAVTIAVQRCPLKDAWVGAGLPPARVGTLCRLAGAFDKGLFEAAGCAFANETWHAARGDDGCCRIRVG